MAAHSAAVQTALLTISGTCHLCQATSVQGRSQPSSPAYLQQPPGQVHLDGTPQHCLGRAGPLLGTRPRPLRCNAVRRGVKVASHVPCQTTAWPHSAMPTLALGAGCFPSSSSCPPALPAATPGDCSAKIMSTVAPATCCIGTSKEGLVAGLVTGPSEGSTAPARAPCNSSGLSPAGPALAPACGAAF